jgi:hypothetical protein
MEISRSISLVIYIREEEPRDPLFQFPAYFFQLIFIVYWLDEQNQKGLTELKTEAFLLHSKQMFKGGEMIQKNRRFYYRVIKLRVSSKT